MVNNEKQATANSKALGAIRSGLLRGILDDVADEYDAKVVWEYLKIPKAQGF
jgi:hypothetical protein